jgi:hypothetical protein
MRFCASHGAALLLAAIITCCQPYSVQAAPGRLQALAARQDLRDMVCYALADGSINRAERRTILVQSKKVLSADEYGSFKQWLDRIAPPPKPTAQEVAKIAARKKAVELAKREAEQRHIAQQPAIPNNVIQPERVEQTQFLR